MGTKETKTTKEVSPMTTLDRLDEYGPNDPSECHYGACHETATDVLAGVPYCGRHQAARIALRSRLIARTEGTR
jgi:hypothetical protein